VLTNLQANLFTETHTRTRGRMLFFFLHKTVTVHTLEHIVQKLQHTLFEVGYIYKINK